MEKEIIKDVIRWDMVNWAKAIDFWEENVDLENKKYQCLELGASYGGLSLWLALNQNYVLCSDVFGPEKSAESIHAKHNCTSKIQYAAIDATDIPFENHFDIVTFKSILGGISSNDRNEYKKRTIDEIYKALKPGGILLFAENLQGCFLHKALRKRFGTKSWNYLKVNEISEVFSSFKEIKYTSVGFLGCMGRNEEQRNMLGKFDNLLDKILPNSFKYIAVGIAIK